MWEILLIFFLLFIVIQTIVIAGLVLYRQLRLNRIETYQTHAPNERQAPRKNQAQASTNDSTRPIVTEYNARSDSRENELVTSNCPVQTNVTNTNAIPQMSTERVYSILPKIVLSDAKQSQVQAKLKEEKIDIHDKMIDAQNKINNKHLSSSDDDSDTDSTMSSATVLDAKTRKPFKADPGAQTSNFTQYSVKNACKQTPIASVNISTTGFTESKLSPIIYPKKNVSANAGINNSNVSKAPDKPISNFSGNSANWAPDKAYVLRSSAIGNEIRTNNQLYYNLYQ